MSSIFDGIGDDSIEQLDENLRKWFKEKWVRFGPDGKIRGACARGDDSEGKPKCLPQKKAQNLGKKGRKYAASKKRREDPNPERRGPAKNVATKKKTDEGVAEALVHRSYVGSSEPKWNIRDNSRKLRQRKNEVILANATPKIENSYKRGFTRDKEYRKKSDFVGYHFAYIDGKLAHKIPDNAGPGRPLRYGGGGFIYGDTKEPFVKADFVHFTPDRGVIAYDVSGSSDAAGPNVTVDATQQTMEDQTMTENKCPECGGPMYHESMMNEKQDACYHKVKSRYKVWPSAYASGALVQCRKKGASNWGTGGKKKNESNIMKGIVNEEESVLVLYIDGKPSAKYAIGHEAKTAMERLQAKFPNKKIELKREVREASSPAQQAAIAINMKKRGEKPKNVDEAKAKQYVKPYIEDGKQVGWKSSDGYHVKYWQMFAKDSAIKHAKLNPDEVQEDYTGQFAAEKTPAINPYGGLKDNQFRGAISEEPTTSGPIGTQPGGWRKYKPKPAGQLDEEYLDEGVMQKIGAAALAAALALGSTAVKAEPVYVYKTPTGEVKAVLSPTDIPANAMRRLVVDTENDDVAILGKDGSETPIKLDPSTVNGIKKQAGIGQAKPVQPKSQISANTTSPEVKSALLSVANKMKDPESAIFSDLTQYYFDDGTSLIVGTVNAKNSYGGYAGGDMFISTPTGLKNIGYSGKAGLLGPGYWNKDNPSLKLLSNPGANIIGDNSSDFITQELQNYIALYTDEQERNKFNQKNIKKGKQITNAPKLVKIVKLNTLKYSALDEDTSYAGGMGQGGNAGQSYRKFTPKSAGTFKEEQLDEKCWDTHKQVGMKTKGGKSVPNCVPKESAIMKGINRLI